MYYFFKLVLIILSFNNIKGLECTPPSCLLATGVCSEPTTATQIGRLCSECNYRGDTIDGGAFCNCTRHDLDPYNACATPSTYPPLENEIIYIHYFTASCSCYEDYTYGCWKYGVYPPPFTQYVSSLEEEIYRYGFPFPPVCSECLTPFHGPLPETITASANYQAVQACTQLGGLDPILLTSSPTAKPTTPNRLLQELQTPISSGWKECAGHGFWNSTWHGCQCDTGWGLNMVDDQFRTVDEQYIYICNICVGPYGPPVPEQQDYLPTEVLAVTVPYCSVPFTPDPLDRGILKECSGHGTFSTAINSCICDQSEELGFFNLTLYELTEETVLLVGDNDYITVDITYSVWTCLSCITDVSEVGEGRVFTIDTGCRVNGTYSPTYPTTSPTENPTKNPSRNPTKNPTVNPTTNPTLNPTENPTKNPSKHPTLDPTKNPSKTPSVNPSRNPTLTPTHLPTKRPSLAPTQSPTRNPTINPTENPTENPTKSPSKNPSKNPSLTPSLNPTKNPTRKPSESPTSNPSRLPTSNPSRTPTLPPTKNPTQKPSKSPSSNPSVSPSTSPTKNPSKNPTKDPTLNPSKNPTTKPTFNPSKNPSVNPTKNPTLKPTKAPTKNPSINPTKNPTVKPTTDPTKNPTKKPTDNPTTATPTNNPTTTCQGFISGPSCQVAMSCSCSQSCQ